MNVMVTPQTFEHRLDRPALAGRIGLIVLSTDEVGEAAFKAPIPRDVARVFTTRTGYVADEASQGELILDTSFRVVANSLPPGDRIDVLAFSCTSATVATGIEGILKRLSEARPGLGYTSPAIGAVNALRAVGAQRIALLTPYPVKTHNLFVPFFETQGFAVVADGTFDLGSDAEIGELSRDSIFSAAHALTQASNVDALFVSCTATPVVPLIEELEAAIGTLVVSSSQAMAWDALRLLGYAEPIEGFGNLMRQSR